MSAARVLIVEDSEDVAAALQIVLGSAGHDAATAGTVQSAVAQAIETPVDVMLLDLMLPDGDGLGVLEALDAEGRRPRTTIALTGRDDSATHDRCRAAGCVEVLLKPVPMRTLLARVAMYAAV